jgi:DNA polymerase delta subunit 1
VCEKCGKNGSDNDPNDPNDPNPNPVIRIVGASEKELLENFCELIRKTDPDILTGYNTWGFDDKYVWTRMALHKVDTAFLTRINKMPASLQNKKLSSGAYGQNEFIFIECPGRETFDILVSIRREHKLESYTLDNVSNNFLGSKKVDLLIRKMFAKLKGNPEDVSTCAVYCVQDSNLVMNLFGKLNLLTNSIEMAKATYVPMAWLLFRGQQCKVFSLILRDSMAKGFTIHVTEKRNTEKFKGATVIEPMIGMYYEPIAGLDFASLYPSIMMAYNMCYTTYIADEETLKYCGDNGIPYETIEWESCPVKDCSGSCKHEKIKNSNRFVQAHDEKGNPLEKGVKGILYDILWSLLIGRRDTKLLMAQAKDSFTKSIYNGKQLAQKVTMNSVYGFTGASNGFLPLNQIASSVTATGRKMIDQASRLARDKFGAITIYGDSIPGYEIITVGNGNEFTKDIPIEEFADCLEESWEEYRGFKIDDIEIKDKECKILDKSKTITTLTHEGFQNITRVIRHRTKKRLFRIKARDLDGSIRSVVVTEGHSLILHDKTLATAEQLQVGQMLHSVPSA